MRDLTGFWVLNSSGIGTQKPWRSEISLALECFCFQKSVLKLQCLSHIWGKCGEVTGMDWNPWEKESMKREIPGCNSAKRGGEEEIKLVYYIIISFSLILFIRTHTGHSSKNSVPAWLSSECLLNMKSHEIVLTLYSIYGIYNRDYLFLFYEFINKMELKYTFFHFERSETQCVKI